MKLQSAARGFARVGMVMLTACASLVGSSRATPRQDVAAAVRPTAVSGPVWAISSRTTEVARVFTGRPTDEQFGASITGNVITRATGFETVFGAPGANPDPQGGSPFGALIVMDPANGESRGRVDGNALAGGPVRRLGESSTLLGHVGGSALVWGAYGAPGEPGRDEQGVVVVTGSFALREHYRIVGRAGALFGWEVRSVDDISGGPPRVLDFVVTAPLESRGRKAREAGAIYAFETQTSAQLYRVRGPHRHGRFGYAVASAGDRDGDGLRDLWVSAPGSTEHGVAGVVILISLATGAEMARIDAPVGAQQFGYAISSVSDVDGDGVVDLLVSAPGTARSRRKPDAGLVILYSGIDGTELRRWRGTRRGERLGTSLSTVGTLTATERRLLIGAEAGGAGRLDFYAPDGGRTLRLVGPANSFLAASIGHLPDLDGDGHFELLVSLPGASRAFVPE